MRIKTFALFILVPLLLNSAINDQKDSLDVIKSFKPNDKYFKAALVTLHFKIETSPIPEVEKLFKAIVNRYKLPVSAANTRNGIYKGESPYDAYDYKHIVTLEIKDQKIVNFLYDEIHKNGKTKKNDKKYNQEMSSSGTTPAKAYPIMEKQLLKNQDLMKVDAVSGATYSLYRLRYATIIALIKALLAVK